MAGANPERTSWTTEEVRGRLRPVWYKPIEPYIPQKVQIVAANDTLYISTAKGLYALDAATGSEKWVYPTELPLGHSPTVVNGVAYVGGFDHKIHAIDAFTGRGLWTFEAEAGFDTNPLVVNGMVYAGNRDGYMYAIYAHESPQRGTLAWKYKTGGPIHFSAAYKDNTIYFASNDSYAYALNATTGQLVWKSSKLPGAGFHSWWPVIYQDMVILAGSTNYRTNVAPGTPSGVYSSLHWLDRDAVYPNHLTAPKGTPVGPRGADGWIDASPIAQYFEAKPWRRTYLVLNRLTGQEITYDFDGDGKREYAPILWTGTHAGNLYPPIVGPDGILYQKSSYMSAPYIPGGQVAGWRPGTKYISTPSSVWIPVDEPQAYAGGGNVIYWSHSGDQSAGAFDISIPNTRFWDNGDPGIDWNREWVYFDNYGLINLAPGYSVMYNDPGVFYEMYGKRNGVYSNAGDQNPPIPYKGKVYLHRSNAIIAFGNTSSSAVALPLYRTVTPPPASMTLPTVDQLKQKLAAEVQKMVNAGHLRPGYAFSGMFDAQGKSECGDNLADYWHNPSDTLYALIRALPHLPADLQNATRAYLQSEFASYAPYNVIHVGWRDGANREAFDLPPDVAADLANHPPTIWSSYNFVGWGGMDTGAKFPP